VEVRLHDIRAILDSDLFKSPAHDLENVLKEILAKLAK